MITNERQYRITRSDAARFRKSIGALAATGPRLIQAEREAM